MHLLKRKKIITLKEFVNRNVNPKKSIYVLPFVKNMNNCTDRMCNRINLSLQGIFLNWSNVIWPKPITQYLTTAEGSGQYVYQIKKTCLQLNCEQNKCQITSCILYGTEIKLNGIVAEQVKKKIKTFISQTCYLQINYIQIN